MQRLDVQLEESHKRIKTAVQASGTTLTELYGVGPILACELIGYTGDVRRFTARDNFASSRTVPAWASCTSAARGPRAPIRLWSRRA